MGDSQENPRAWPGDVEALKALKELDRVKMLQEMTDKERQDHLTGLIFRRDLQPAPSWNRMIASWDSNKMALHIYRGIDCGWDLCRDGQPPFVMVEAVFGEGESSKDLAYWTDDNIEGLFYYRDWTVDTLPTCAQGDIYWAGFSFQKASDAREFARRARVIGSWDEGYPEWRDRCNKKRESPIQAWQTKGK